jgi:hypothetical protein
MSHFFMILLIQMNIHKKKTIQKLTNTFMISTDLWDILTNLTFYGGVNEIGDNKILLEDKDTRVTFHNRSLR